MASISDDDYLMTVFKILQYTFGALSSLASLTIIIGFLFSGAKQLFTFELIFYLTFSSFISSISYFLMFIDDETNYDKTICRIQSWFQVSSEMSVVIFATIISIHCYISIRNYYLIDHLENRKKFMRIFCICVGFGIPIIVTSFFEFFNILGVTKIWCWIDSKIIHQVIYLSIIWIFLIVCTLFSCMAFNVNIRDNDAIHRKNYVKMLYLYPIVCYITWFVATVDRISFFLNYKEWNNFITIFDIIVFNLQGFSFAMIFLYTNRTKVKDKVKEFIRSKLGFCFKVHSESNLNLSNFIERNDSFDFGIIGNESKYFDLKETEQIDIADRNKIEAIKIEINKEKT